MACGPGEEQYAVLDDLAAGRASHKLDSAQQSPWFLSTRGALIIPDQGETECAFVSKTVWTNEVNVRANYGCHGMGA